MIAAAKASSKDGRFQSRRPTLSALSKQRRELVNAYTTSSSQKTLMAPEFSTIKILTELDQHELLLQLFTLSLSTRISQHDWDLVERQEERFTEQLIQCLKTKNLIDDLGEHYADLEGLDTFTQIESPELFEPHVSYRIAKA
ncbi:MAG: hypothetical protein Q9213_000360 [Squamulea squamosa]